MRQCSPPTPDTKVRQSRSTSLSRAWPRPPSPSLWLRSGKLPAGVVRAGWAASVLAGIGAAIVSLIECVLGLLLAGAAGPDGNANRAGALFDLINRLDGVKMLALATMALGAAGLVHRDRLLPAWLSHTAVLLASAMTASSVGYLLLNNTVAQAAALSLPLLLIWVAGTGLALGRRGR